VHGLRRDLAHSLLGLDRLPRGRASVGNRAAERPARERLADRAAGIGLGPARRRRRTPRPTGYGLAVIDPAAGVAIDVHVHTELSRAGHDPMPPALRTAAARYFRSDQALPTVDDVAAYYRER